MVAVPAGAGAGGSCDPGLVVAMVAVLVVWCLFVCLCFCSRGLLLGVCCVLLSVLLVGLLVVFRCLLSWSWLSLSVVVVLVVAVIILIVVIVVVVVVVLAVADAGVCNDEGPRCGGRAGEGAGATLLLNSGCCIPNPKLADFRTTRRRLETSKLQTPQSDEFFVVAS